MSTASLLLRSDAARASQMVGDSSRVLKRFYFLERQLALLQAGWMPGTHAWEIKLLLPELLWLDALVAWDLRERVLELRYPERTIDTAPDDRLLDLWRSFGDAPNSTAFALGLARVLRPTLHAAFRRYLDHADQLDDGPTVRILRHALADGEAATAQLQQATDQALQVYPEHADAAHRWIDGLKRAAAALPDLLSMADVSDDVPTFDPAALGGVPLQIARRGVRDKRFDYTRYGWPDSLDPAFGPGEGLRLQVRQGVHHLNEVWAAEMAAACLWDLADDAPADFFRDAARWCYDEIRHCRMGFARLREWGFTMPEMSMGSYSYDAGADAAPLERLAIIFYFESTYIQTKWQRKDLFGALGDRLSSHDMDYDWADEQIHVHYGTRWLKHFLSQEDDKRRPVDFRAVAESLVQKERDAATDADRAAVHAAYERMMARAAELAGSAPAGTSA